MRRIRRRHQFNYQTELDDWNTLLAKNKTPSLTAKKLFCTFGLSNQRWPHIYISSFGMLPYPLLPLPLATLNPLWGFAPPPLPSRHLHASMFVPIASAWGFLHALVLSFILAFLIGWYNYIIRFIIQSKVVHGELCIHEKNKKYFCQFSRGGRLNWSLVIGIYIQ